MDWDRVCRWLWEVTRVSTPVVGDRDGWDKPLVVEVDRREVLGIKTSESIGVPSPSQT